MTNLILKIQEWWQILGSTFGLLRWEDILDIIIVSLGIYFILLFIKQSRSYLVLYLSFLLIGVSYLSKIFNLGLTRQIMQTITTFVVLIFIVVFQREIRRFFAWVFASGKLWVQSTTIVSRETINEIVDTVEEMAKKKIGAIIVFPGDYPVEQVVEGGFPLDGRISRPLLLSIFDTRTPGHDGALVVDRGRARRFGVHLPLAENYQGYDKAGTRHRAAAGITEKTDALAIVVSEERGQISLAQNGKLELYTDMEALEEKLRGFVSGHVAPEEKGKFWNYFARRNFFSKLSALALSVILWFSFVSNIGVTAKDYTLPLEIRSLAKGQTVDYISAKEVKVTLTGKEIDLRNLKDGELKAVVNVGGFGDGWHSLRLTGNNISYPSYLKLTTISPEWINFNLIRAQSAPASATTPNLGP